MTDTGGSGARALYNGCVKCIREGFPNVSIRKMILANSNSISKKQAIFEVLVGDQVSQSGPITMSQWGPVVMSHEDLRGVDEYIMSGCRNVHPPATPTSSAA